MLALTLIFTIGAVVFLVLGICGLFSNEKDIVYRRLIRYTAQKKGINEILRSGQKSLSRVLLRGGGRVFASLKLSEVVEKKLARADLPLRGGEFLFMSLMPSLCFPLAIWFITGNLVLSIVGGMITLAAPWFYLGMRQQKRLETFNKQLCDCLAVITNSLRAGYSLLQAMDMVSKEMSPPIADEFGRAIREIQLGTPLETAMNNMSLRVGSEDLDLIIMAMLIQRQIGGNLTEILDNIAETIRERVRIVGEIKTLTAQGRMSGSIIGLLPVALIILLMLISPSYVGILFTNSVGLMFLGVAAAGEVMGALIIRRIVDVQI